MTTPYDSSLLSIPYTAVHSMYCNCWAARPTANADKLYTHAESKNETPNQGCRVLEQDLSPVVEM